MNASFALICHEDKILLFHRDNIPTIPHPDCWQLPGGGREQGETPLQTLKRELVEEVSHAPKTIHFVTKLKQTSGLTSFFICFVGDVEAKKFKHGPGEGQEIGFFTIDEALKLKLTPALKNRFIKYRKELEQILKSQIIPDNLKLT